MDFELKEMPNPVRIKRNPFYERIMKNGFTVREYYSPDEIEKIKNGTLARRIDINELDPEETAAMEEFILRNNGQMG